MSELAADGAHVGLILAAGAGRRLGLGPKAHVTIDGVSLLARAVACFHQAQINRLQVVGRTDDPAIGPVCESLSVRLTHNPHPERGMFSSVRLGLDAVRGEQPTGVVIFPVDHPYVQPATIQALVQALAGVESLTWARPLFEGRHGHPIALGGGLIARLLLSSETVPLSEALAAAGAVPLDVPVDDQGVTCNVNHPADLSATPKP